MHVVIKSSGAVSHISPLKATNGAGTTCPNHQGSDVCVYTCEYRIYARTRGLVTILLSSRNNMGCIVNYICVVIFRLTFFYPGAGGLLSRDVPRTPGLRTCHVSQLVPVLTDETTPR